MVGYFGINGLSTLNWTLDVSLRCSELMLGRLWLCPSVPWWIGLPPCLLGTGAWINGWMDESAVFKDENVWYRRIPYTFGVSNFETQSMVHSGQLYQLWCLSHSISHFQLTRSLLFPSMYCWWTLLGNISTFMINSVKYQFSERFLSLPFANFPALNLHLQCFFFPYFPPFFLNFHYFFHFLKIFWTPFPYFIDNLWIIHEQTRDKP